ncbi:sigma-70 family RNA polymerase sigma factor [Actinocrispum wychmicini]|uniref:RNA polymerase sigma factor n=1 Tax=Actinocrispum wychmicini TaxID=1213861 RepID=A0A4R2J781_9PSEU|nr:sigma-70 family RNA polymerase sigma factor [Actinocrispum wychmicini]TCO52368.1 RNA polymerase primary sigma factor/RNA polymerase nonessential primary-like sigma factor [Actinocrispum wychmicini]
MSVETTKAVQRPREDADLVGYYLAEVGATPLLTASEEVEISKQIEAGLYAAELLRRADEGEEIPHDPRELKILAREGARAKDHMIRANLRLVVSQARKRSQAGLPMLDIIQEGNLGLIRAVEKFDYAKGFKFSTYAMAWIKQAIGRGLAEQTRTVRLPVHVVEELAKFRRVERKLETKLNRDPTPAEIAEEVGTTAERIVELRRAGRDAVSLDTPVGEDGDSKIADLVPDMEAENAAETLEREELYGELRRQIDMLPQREALIISLRFGLHDGHEYTLQQVADRIGLTRERIRQLEKHALAELRHPGRTQNLLALAG